MTPTTFPTELKAWPRRVRRRHWYQAIGIWFLRLFIAPHMIIGTVLLLCVPGRVIWLVAGHDIEGTATQLSRSHSRKNGDSYTLAYTYKLNGTTKSSTRSITDAQFAQLLGGERPRTDRATVHIPIRVRTAGVGPWVYAEPILDGDEQWRSFALLVVGALFWNAILSIFVWFAWISPWRTRRLYRMGTPVEGKITGKGMHSTKRTTFYDLGYEFTAADVGHVKATQTVRRWLWTSAERGQEVTVLYWPGKKKPSIIYEYGDYVCVE